jgi:hypothetical protein
MTETKVNSKWGGLMVCSARKIEEVVELAACSERRSKEAVGGESYTGTKMNSKQGGLVECSARKIEEVGR